VVVYMWLLARRKKTALRYTSLSLVRQAAGSGPGWRRHLPPLLMLLALAALLLATARPVAVVMLPSQQETVILAMDVSGSMLARDFKPDRLGAAKEIGIKFISGRPNDRIGLVVFAGESFTLCPLTTDHATLINMFHNVNMGILEDGTAIGSGLATAVTRLKDSHAKSRVIILLTDGVNNRGEIAPLTAAEIAKSFGIRVYTVGVGTMGTAPYPVQTPFGTQYQNMKVEIDEDLLTSISKLTGGEYFRATNNTTLEEVYGKIDKLEKSKIEVAEYRSREEKFRGFLLAAFAILVVEFTLRRTLLQGIQ